MARLAAIILVTLLPLASAWANIGHDESAAFQKLNEHLMICYPKTHPHDTLVPPCISVNEMEKVCRPRGSHPQHLLAHAQCVCGGSFFEDWMGCQACLYQHGLRSERDLAYYSDLIRVVSTELCTATPTAGFGRLFNHVMNDPSRVVYPTTGATYSHDYFPSQTAVSLYYTPTKAQGPGRVTVAQPHETKGRKPQGD